MNPNNLYNSFNYRDNTPQLSNRNIIVERHIIPADLYQSWYINTNNTIPSHIHRRAERMNHNLNQSLSDILYGNRQESNISVNQPVNTDATSLFNNMRFIVRDSNGNQADYNIPLGNNVVNEFSNILNQMLDPSVPLNTIFTNSNRLTTEQINNNTTLRNFELSNNDTNEDENTETNRYSDRCPICQEEYNNNEELRLINNCSHEFHKSCIDIWLNSNNNCPICRGNII
jgi:hypothetical protein